MSTGISRPALVEDDGSGTTGTVQNAAFWADIFDRIDRNPSGWTGYVPAWTAAVSNPALGDGTLTGKYCKVGKLVLFHLVLLVGAGTTLGSGAWHFSLPTTCVLSTGHVFPGRLYDAAGGAGGVVHYAASGVLVDATKFVVIYDQEVGSDHVQSNKPFAWAENDLVIVNGWYLEA